MWNFNHREELESLLSEKSISKREVCLIGSLCLENIQIRNNRDVDICIYPKKKELPESGYLSDNVNILRNKYASLGIKDEDLVENPIFHDLVDGFKVIRPEIEFSFKHQRRQEKDIADIENLSEYADTSASWDWDLVLRCVVERRKINKHNHNKKKSKNREKTIQKIKQALKGLKKDPLHTTKKIRIYCKKKLANIYLSAFLNKAKKCQKLIQSFLTSKVIFDIVSNYSEQAKICYNSRALFSWQGSYHSLECISIIREYLRLELSSEPASQKIFLKLDNLLHNQEDWILHDDTISSSNSKFSRESFSEIRLSRDLGVIAGQQQIAKALLNGTEYLPVTISRIYTSQAKQKLHYDSLHNLSHSDLGKIKKKYTKICKENGLIFYAIIWPPAHNFFEDITHEVAERHEILEYRDYNFSDDSRFFEFVRGIYSLGFDGISRWNIEYKLSGMLNYRKKIRVISFIIKNQVLKRKKNSDIILNYKAHQLKKICRHKYSKKINDYFHDIIIHITDNYAHNLAVQDFIDKQIPETKILSHG